MQSKLKTDYTAEREGKKRRDSTREGDYEYNKQEL